MGSEEDDDQAPLRSELLNADQMEQHGRALAGMHALRRSGGRDSLLPRLGENERVLQGTCRKLTAEIKSRQRITPAGEWLLDNYHLVEEQIRIARSHLPTGYSRELPRLARGSSVGLPRIYDLALEAISHGDGRVDAATLVRFLIAYQSGAPLLLGELWAFPIMLRLALIENLRRVAVRIDTAQVHRQVAVSWADRMMDVAERDPKSLVLAIADMARSDPPMASPFVAELARRLQGHGPALAWPLTWVEQRLAESSRTIEQMVAAENQRQAADQVSIGNTVASLRLLGAIDWRGFVESTSQVEAILRDDPGRTYGAMDFATRDRYRVAIDRLAKRSANSESEVAHAAIRLAQHGAAAAGAGDRRAHVGYFLIDDGYAELELAVQARASLIRGLSRWARGAALVLYLGSIAGLTVILASALVWLSGLLAGLHFGLQAGLQAGTNSGLLSGLAPGDGWRALALAALALPAATPLASALTHWACTRLVTPQPLPRLDLSRGLPRELRTLVVVPALLDSERGIDDLVEGLEIRFLGNNDPQLHFALLTDFRDAAQASLPGDAALLLHARCRIDALNEIHRRSGNDRFHLLHRPRLWNPAERIWMGYERKRGKLAALNVLLRGGGTAAFSVCAGATAELTGIRYVITLDSDTQLPRDSARQFVGAMAHPLNRPQFDPVRRVVRAGYAILQPGMATGMSRDGRSRYARWFGSEPGIDPYTRSVSDVYQDLFGEGSFIGKGIYDVEAFETALRDRLPPNRVLSHDLLEGCYARSGLMSDVHLLEEHPTSYRLDMLRHQRWMRGDWQVATWCLPQVPGADGRMVRNPLSALSRWKIIDNLRRCLAPASIVALLALGWLALPRPGLYTLDAGAVFALVPLMGLFVGVFGKPDEVRFTSHLVAAVVGALRGLRLAVFRIACLPFEALAGLDAMVRTTWRLGVSHRHLLEWGVAATPPSGFPDRLFSTYRRMWISPASATLLITLLVIGRPAALASAAPILLLWMFAPGWAWWLGTKRGRIEDRTSPAQELFLRRQARKTWAFFERFVTAQDHFLPPDNFQESPGPVLAHRTSPTNMGLALLANLAAFDFGYHTMAALLGRTEDAFDTMVRLERHQGHFLNWYDTRSLAALAPRYVSSVDSGNLAGHLMTLNAGLLALPDVPLAGPRPFEGLFDTLCVLSEVLDARASVYPASAALRAALSQLRALLHEARATPPPTVAAQLHSLERICALAAQLRQGERRGEDQPAVQVAGQGAQGAERRTEAGAAAAEFATWTEAFGRQCEDALVKLRACAPWSTMAPAPEHAGSVIDLGAGVSLRDLARLCAALLPEIDEREAAATQAQTRAWLQAYRLAVASAGSLARATIARCERLAAQAASLAVMDYEFLYDPGRQLLSIGFNIDSLRLDAACYDLLASEARLSTFVAIAQGRLPQQSWFALGRLLCGTDADPILVSWSGSMFEYLMPLLVMPTYEGTLLDQSCRGAVQRQIDHGERLGLPWGISESGYNSVDANLNYQYRAFGVPGLGLKRVMDEDAVVAPYACAMALMLAPRQACANLQRLAESGVVGRYGFYEAVDFTPSRLARGQARVVVRSFMAHHQGMILLSLAHCLLDRPMQRRFESVPAFQATLLLLQERIPATPPVRADTDPGLLRGVVVGTGAVGAAAQAPLVADTPAPEVQLLSNGRYRVMITGAGGGYSRWKDLALTRWREDASCDNWGSFLYIRDVASATFWSATHQPSLVRAQAYEAMFSEGRAEFRRRDEDCETHSEIVVSPEDDVELRRVRVSNHARQDRVIELTSYAEVVLAAPGADLMHPGFGKLFVQTQILADRQAIVCTRRPREAGEAVPWLFHLIAVHGTDPREISFETDRMRFLGRGATVAQPQALLQPGPLSGSQGSVLDPIVAIRCHLAIAAEQSVTIDVVTGAAETREACVALIDKYRDRHMADRAFDLATTLGGVALRQIDASDADAQVFRRLAGSVLYANSRLRADTTLLMSNRRGQSGLWGYAISGDLPIVLLKIADAAHIELARQLIQCHAYWRLKGLEVDLVIWNEEQAGYRARLQEQITGLIAHGVEPAALDRPGGIFLRASAEPVSNEDRILLHAVARAVLSGERGSLAEQVDGRGRSEKRPPRLVPVRAHRPAPAAAPASARSELPEGVDPELGNAQGGFSADGSEYRIRTARTSMTPLPWVNVIANPNFGTVVTESGLGYTWSTNAHEFRLSPWSDDAVGASGGEAIFLRDEETGHFWSPTPLPGVGQAPGGQAPYITRHGFGYSIFEHAEGGMVSELSVFVDAEEAVKFLALKVSNRSGRARKLSATGYVEWVLGDVRSRTAMHVCTQIDPASGALFARNAYSADFSRTVAFFNVDSTRRTLTGDRTEFLGRNGTLQAPAAMRRTVLSGRLGAALDPCGAIRAPFELAAGEERELIFHLGSADTLEQAQSLALRLRRSGSARLALKALREKWRRSLGAVQIDTPDRSINVLANGWLVYQTLSCRFWGRSGYYQSGGAFGFRDQLQDALALVYARPELVRAHLLRCAGRQFPEGDVQHWWHPPSGRGVRTRCSDDYLWLPLAVQRYVEVTGDAAVLDEPVHFIEGRAIAPNEESYYDAPERSAQSASLYAHCVRAIEHGLRFGSHGLPLMGSGDWNDGMNLVGIGGKGESVWLGFFLYQVLDRFGALAQRHGDPEFAAHCLESAQSLQRSLAESGWDGQWYRRAYFDDGTPLGSHMNSECMIDSLAQSWSVLSGAGEGRRARAAMDALDAHLVDRGNGLVRLLEPPFDVSNLNPGYIKGYVPGVRENGGQYTHAAVWAAMAYAALGDGARALELLSMINPVRRLRSARDQATYQAEPYVVAADVYALAPHAGRGGWTWYTGSAGWMYRLIVESILGLSVEGTRLRLRPCLAPEWSGYSIVYRFGDTPYRIRVSGPVTANAAADAGMHAALHAAADAGDGPTASARAESSNPQCLAASVVLLTLDGAAQANDWLELVDDGREHQVDARIVPAAAPGAARAEPAARAAAPPPLSAR